jgi:hypothetical protein
MRSSTALGIRVHTFIYGCIETTYESAVYKYDTKKWLIHLPLYFYLIRPIPKNFVTVPLGGGQDLDIQKI